jgi:hypothetical protein
MLTLLPLSLYNYCVHEQGDWWQSNGMSGVIERPGPT